MLSGIKIKPKQAPNGNDGKPPQREAWMDDAGVVALSSSFAKPAPVKPADRAPAKPKPLDLATIRVDQDRRATQVGDGGASWRRRIERRQREREQAEINSSSTSSSVAARPKSNHPLLAPEFNNDRGAQAKPIDYPKTDDDLNRLAADALRAKLMGDMQRHDALQKRIESARSAPRIEILPDLDADGRPVRFSNTNRDDIRYLAQQERLQRRNQFQTDSAMQIARNAKFSTSTDEQFDTSHSDMFERRPKKAKADADDVTAKQKNLVASHRSFQSQIDSCLFCLEGRRIQRHLVVTIGRFCYLSLPATSPLGLGHCYIVPTTHTPSMTATDEDVFEEIQTAKDQLVRMFETTSQKVIFLETYSNRPRHHAVIECIPMDDEMYIDAPIYFKKGLLEADEEWSSHKKIIEISRKKPIRSAIPSGFPYFCVEFGSDGTGYAHVIEDSRKFSERFGLQIICGLLNEHPEIVFRAKPESRENQLERMKQFREMWDKFDCLSARLST